MMKPEPQNLSLERNILVSKSLHRVVALLVFLVAATGVLYAQELDEGSLVPAEDAQVDAAANGNIGVEGTAPAPAAAVESNIEKEMEAEVAKEPAAAPAKAGTRTEVNAGEGVAEEAFTEAAADLRESGQEAAIVTKPSRVRPPAGAKLSSVVREEALRRQAEEQHGRECLAEAEKAFEKRDYENATRMFAEAKKYLGNRPGTETELQRAKDRLGETYYKWALLLRRQGDLEEAEKKANLAQGERYAGAGKLANSIKNEKTEKPAKAPATPSARWKEPEFKTKEESLSELLVRGRQYYMSGELDEAQVTYERVLKRDPYNTEAMRLMDKVAHAKYDRGTMELNATRHNMMADVRKAWNPRNYALMANPDTAGALQPKVTAPKVESDRLEILSKMEKIKIPEIDFRQANINDVVAFLQTASVEFDESESESEKKGVNIILNLGVAPPAAAPASDKGEPFPEAAAPASGPTEVPLITFSARYITLLEALKIVTSVANLKYRIEDTVVMIVPINWPEGKIVNRMYDVLATVNDRIATLAPEVGKGAAPARDKFIALGTGDTSERGDWKQFFADMGVPWPEGSKIKYLPSIGKISVANTADNLTIFEKILATLNVVPNQIEIEARFVEVRQTDLSSLGFEWLLTDAWEIAQKKGSASQPLGSRQRIKMNANDSTGGFTKGNRFLSGLSLGGTGSASVGDDVLTLASVLTNPEMSLIIHALEQKGDADLLSAPKVTTQSGQEATIKVVTEYIYPTEFTVTPITGAGLNGLATIVGGVVEPGGFETREVGVILKVTPEVSTEGQMINLTMSPEVVTDPDWKDYGSTYTAPDGSQQVLTMLQPFFHTRAITTSISIYNGATVAMGGMINESRTETDDKIPFMGDIPLIGRLFRSKIDQSEKRNLLIFVTARLVDPAGKPVMTTEGIGKTLEAVGKTLSPESTNP
jgi:general secretion pathway protein D